MVNLNLNESSKLEYFGLSLHPPNQGNTAAVYLFCRCDSSRTQPKTKSFWWRAKIIVVQWLDNNDLSSSSNSNAAIPTTFSFLLFFSVVAMQSTLEQYFENSSSSSYLSYIFNHLYRTNFPHPMTYRDAKGHSRPVNFVIFPTYSSRNSTKIYYNSSQYSLSRLLFFSICKKWRLLKC